jgi:hypothetical protein
VQISYVGKVRFFFFFSGLCCFCFIVLFCLLLRRCPAASLSVSPSFLFLYMMITCSILREDTSR